MSADQTELLDGLHLIALIKGIHEGDQFAHFASLLGFGFHVAQADAMGLVRRISRRDLELTDSGREFYDDYRLVELSKGRATNWLSVGREIVDFAAAELGRRKSACLPEHLR